MKRFRDVYVIECKKNKKRYVGSTSDSYKERYKAHIRALNRHEHSVEELQKDYDMYGEDAFRLIFIGSFDGSKALHIEQLLQYLYNSKSVEGGYNYLDKSGINDKQFFLNEIEELKRVSYLTNTSIEDVIRKDNEICIEKTITVDFKKLQKLAKEKGFSITELENELGFSHCQINRWKRMMAKADSLYIVAKYLGTTMEDLLICN